MPQVSNSPPVDASATQRGLVNLLAQTFTGVKTFAAALIASAGIQLSALWNTNGTGASDVVIKAGTNVADGSTNATAKLLSVRTGVSGSEAEYAYVTKQGLYVGGASPNSGKNVAAFAVGTSTFELTQGAGNITPMMVARATGGKAAALGAGLNSALFSFDSTGTFVVVADTRANINGGTAGAGTPMLVIDQAGVISAPGSGVYEGGVNWVSVRSGSGSGPTDTCVKIGTKLANASVNAAAKLLTVRTGLGGSEVEKAYIDASANFVTGGSVSFGADLKATTATGSMRDVDGNQRLLLQSNGLGGLQYAQGAASDGASAVAHVLTNAFALTTATAKILSLEAGAGNANEKAYVTALGTLGHPGSIPDASGSPGNATQNGPRGRAALANAATTVTITNNQVTVNSFVAVEWETDPGQRHTVTYAAGSFTLTLSGAAAGNKTFRYYVTN